MAQKLTNYLRTYRKRAGLNQGEMAFLLGTTDGSRVSRYEQFDREPELPTALAYEIIFRAPTDQLFAGLYEGMEQRVRERADLLVQRLESEPLTPLSKQKLTALRNLISKDQ